MERLVVLIPLPRFAPEAALDLPFVTGPFLSPAVKISAHPMKPLGRPGN